MKRITALFLAVALSLPSFIFAAEATPPGERLSGADRYTTATAVSRAAYEVSDIAIIASGESYPDALGAAALVDAFDAPILLVQKNTVPNATLTELKRLGVKTVYLIGGKNTIDPSVEDALEAASYIVERIEGADRYATAVKIAEEVSKEGKLSHVYLAYGLNFPDALSAGAPASISGDPILYTGPTLSAATKDALTKYLVKKVTVIGGESTVPEVVLEEIKEMGIEVTRIAGETRYETSAAVAKTFPAGTKTAILASGAKFPDALVGAAVANVEEAPILLVDGSLSKAVEEVLVANPHLEKIYILGGTSTIVEEVMVAANDILNAKAENKPPIIKGPNEVEVTQSEDIDFWKAFTVSDDKDPADLIEKTVNDQDFNGLKIGSQKVTLIATDLSGAKTEKVVTFNVRERDGLDVNSPTQVDRARDDLMRLLNEERAARKIRLAESSKIHSKVLDEAAMTLAKRWAESKTVQMPPATGLQTVPVYAAGHRGYRTASEVYKSFKTEAGFSNLMKPYGDPTKPYSSVIVGIGVAKDEDGMYYWVFLTGSRWNEYKSLADHIGLSKNLPKPTLTYAKTDPVELAINENYKLLDGVRARENPDYNIQRRVQIVRIQKDGQSFIDAKDFSTGRAATYKVTFVVESHFGVISDLYTQTIHVGGGTPKPDTEPPKTEEPESEVPESETPESEESTSEPTPETP